MTKARNDRKLGVLMDLPASSTGATILANKAIVVVAQPTEGITALSCRLIHALEDFKVLAALGATLAPQTEQPDPSIDGRSVGASPKMNQLPGVRSGVAE